MLKKDDYLYQKGDDGSGFYFVLEGKIEVLVKSDDSDEFKYSRTVDTNEYFCFRKSTEPRSDYAKIASERALVLELDCL